MRRFLRFAVKLLVLILVAMISAVTAMRFAIHGREVVVPKLVGMPYAQAQQVARDSGLILLVEERFYSADVAEGGVITQLPTENIRVRRGGRVRVAVSLGKQRTQIPDIVGQTQRVAEINIHRRGLELGSVALTHVPGTPLGQILAQNPAANSPSARAPRVNVLVSDPDHVQSFLMPDLAGRRLTEVKPQIEASGFKLVTQLVAAEPGAKPDTIIRQSPLPGHKINTGAEIVLTVTK